MRHPEPPCGPTTPAAEDIARAVRPLLPAGWRAVLFGSRARGHARSTSDWDVGILGPEAAPGDLLERIREVLEALPTLHRFEVVDLGAVSGEFRAQALDRAIPLA